MQQFDQDLLSLVEMGKKMVQACDQPQDPDGPSISNLILSLMHIEKILDTGRTFLVPEQMDNLKSINQGMDVLRKDIDRLKQSIDPKEFKYMVDTAGESFKLRFQ
jgi:hypothetical protein